MKPQLKILQGARAGHTEVFSKTLIALGRHPTSDVQFDPDRDLQVSARHALIVLREGKWYVRDAGSRNGTFVNGHKITTDTQLDDTDQIRLGDEGGPVVELRLVADGTPDGITALARPLPPAAAPMRDTAEHAPGKHRPTAPAVRSSTTQRIRIEVGKQTRHLRAVALGLVALLIGASAVFVFVTQRQARARDQEVTAIQARTDSILRAAEAAITALQGEVEGLGTRLRTSQTEVSNLQQRLTAAQASGSSADVDNLKRQLADATQALSYQQVAANVDYASLVEENQFAVAILWAEQSNGSVQTGTAFAVRPDGTMLTNRHVVAGADGTRRAVRLALKFAESSQVWSARILGVSQTADLAAIRVEGIVGGVTAVRGFSTVARTGDPVAVIGFPLGPDLLGAGGGDGEIAKTTFTAGTISKVLETVVQIDGYGAEGASGSPIFNRAGQVVAVLYGGEPEAGGRIVYGVPAKIALEFLNTIR